MRFMLIIVLLFFSADAYGMSELEKAYKKRMDTLYYDAFINRLNRNFKTLQIDGQDKLFQACNEYNYSGNRYSVPKDCDKEIRKQERYEDQYKDLVKKKDEILKEIDEIKIKLIEKFSKLPQWWDDTKKKIMKEIYE